MIFDDETQRKFNSTLELLSRNNKQLKEIQQEIVFLKGIEEELEQKIDQERRYLYSITYDFTHNEE